MTACARLGEWTLGDSLRKMLNLQGLVSSSVQSGGLAGIILSSTGSQGAGEENIPLGTTNQAFLSLLSLYAPHKLPSTFISLMKPYFPKIKCECVKGTQQSLIYTQP